MELPSRNGATSAHDAIADAAASTEPSSPSASASPSPSPSASPVKEAPPSEVFSPADLERFITDGFLLLRDAFPAATARQGRELIWDRLRRDGIDRANPSTWVERHGIAEVYTEADDPLWGDVLTPRVYAALDQLCGRGAYEAFGCGWWMITFPHVHTAPWGAAGKWHVDGASYEHHIDSAESGLVAFFLFSEIRPTEGGTALARGSHRHVAQLLHRHEPNGLRGGTLSYYARQVPRAAQDIVEVTGRPGDVMLVHPFLLHARSKNLGRAGQHSVRIMCNPNIKLRRKMQVTRGARRKNENETELTPVEEAIARAIEALPERSAKRRRR